MSRTQKLLGFAVILAMTVLACSTANFMNTGNNASDNVSNDNDDNAEEADQPNTVLFQDDFSRTSSGWDRYDYGDATTDYGDDVYRIELLVADSGVWANPYKDFTDVIIEVETYKASGGDDNGFGVICRQEDLENFYFFEISSDGYAWIGKYFQGETVSLSNVIQTTEINQGNSTNSLRVECVGNRLSLFVNGTLVIETNDSDLTHGDVGLLAETYSATSTEILFDNFIVTRP
jgi:hypothetical protein